jgi:Ca-activated chloride channel family protein
MRRLNRCVVLTFALAMHGLLPAAGTVAAQDSANDTKCTDDAILVFDASGSMASVGYNELSSPRIAEALEAVRRVIPRVTAHRRIGLVTYGPGVKDACSNIELKVAPQFNSADAIISEIEALQPDGDTPLSQAVLDAAETLRFRERPAVVVLVTDGEETCGGGALLPC